MKKFICVLMLIVCCDGSASTVYFGKNNNIDLILEIAARTAKDQAIRGALLEALEQPKTPRNEALAKNLMQYMQKIDYENTTRMKQIIAQYGWPGIQNFGRLTDNNAFLLVQHADNDHKFQRQILDLLERSLKSNDTTPQHYAYLYDRAHCGQKLYQRYGTQGQCVGHHKWKPFPIEYPDQLDARRQKVGLEKHADYVKTVAQLCP